MIKPVTEPCNPSSHQAKKVIPVYMFRLIRWSTVVFIYFKVNSLDIHTIQGVNTLCNPLFCNLSANVLIILKSVNSLYDWWCVLFIHALCGERIPFQAFLVPDKNNYFSMLCSYIFLANIQTRIQNFDALILTS